jgi:hypothetical protein
MRTSQHSDVKVIAHCEHGITIDGHVPTRNVLDAANASYLEAVLVIGLDRDGNLYAAASDSGDTCRDLVAKFLDKLGNGF